MKTSLELPLFPIGTFKANNGESVKFTHDGLRDLVRNTTYLMARGFLNKPPVGYIHPAARDGHARGHIASVRYANGVAHATIAEPKFIDDVKSGNRLEYSGEIDFVDASDEQGKPVRIGPAIVGVCITGADRPAIKSPLRRTLSELIFSEETTPVDAWEVRSELQKAGLVAQTYDAANGNAYCFSEIDFDPKEFREETKRMTPEEIAQLETMMTRTSKAAADAAIAPLAAKIQKLETDVTGQFKQFSEAQRSHNKCDEDCDKLDKAVPLGKDAADKRRALAHKMVDNTATYGDFIAFNEAVPPRMISGKTEGDKETESADDAKIPKDVLAVMPKHFNDIREPKNEAIIAVGQARYFSDVAPTALKGIENDPKAQLDHFRNYVTTRVNGAVN